MDSVLTCILVLVVEPKDDCQFLGSGLLFLPELTQSVDMRGGMK
jgi:hypothetical protein